MCTAVVYENIEASVWCTNYNNESLFDQKIKTRILCYNIN